VIALDVDSFETTSAIPIANDRNTDYGRAPT
jgi:hypothetical protein